MAGNRIIHSSSRWSSTLSQPPGTVALDGPVASGKSSVGLRLSQRWGHTFIDTGMMYRAITWWALRNGIAPDDPRSGELAGRIHMDVRPGPAGTSVFVDGIDVTADLRDPALEAAVSRYAAVPAVRRVLVEQQRRLAAEGPVVMAGRDIGTVVLPDAELKVYLQASVRERAERRAAELPGPPSVEDVEAALRERARLDSERDVSPLRPADDAIIIDTDDLALDEVVERIVTLACERAAEKRR